MRHLLVMLLTLSAALVSPLAQADSPAGGLVSYWSFDDNTADSAWLYSANAGVAEDSSSGKRPSWPMATSWSKDRRGAGPACLNNRFCRTPRNRTTSAIRRKSSGWASRCRCECRPVSGSSACRWTRSSSFARSTSTMASCWWGIRRPASHRRRRRPRGQLPLLRRHAPAGYELAGLRRRDLRHRPGRPVPHPRHQR